ncbi:hypothetical protein L195_g028701 [Trifolium pratense]|uniref:Transmembrane protein n=1 Tax=Trifolium pratense TaxID=57577 RepID=A0A2K3L2P9_TRIPR|nr:hypothetical protein L195_g028701 [Trifolium pratense]
MCEIAIPIGLGTAVLVVVDAVWVIVVMELELDVIWWTAVLVVADVV